MIIMISSLKKKCVLIASLNFGTCFIIEIFSSGVNS
nr:MAG TPA: hypothetical protein [Caudoviricetes sp.]